MAEIKILANVGTITGSNGVGNVYAASEGTETSKPKILVLPELVGGVTKYRYLTRDAMRNWLNSGNAALATDLNLELFSNKTDWAFVGADGFIVDGSILDTTGVERLFTGQNLYAIKGVGATAAEIAAIRVNISGSETTGATTTTTGGTTTAGATKGIMDYFNEFIADPFSFITNNPLIAAVIGLAVWYFFFRKKTKARARRR